MHGLIATIHEKKSHLTFSFTGGELLYFPCDPKRVAVENLERRTAVELNVRNFTLFDEAPASKSAGAQPAAKDDPLEDEANLGGRQLYGNRLTQTPCSS